MHIGIGVGKFYINVKQAFVSLNYDLHYNICFG